MSHPIRAGAKILAENNALVATAYSRFGPPKMGSRPPVSERFAMVVRSISGQQLSVTAAATIYQRVASKLGEVTPERVAATEGEALRECGLSWAKVAALHDLADHVLTGRLRMESLGRVSAESAVEQLVAVRGIGRWTAEMFLIGALHRPDVWPTGDLGVRNGFAKLAGLRATPSADELESLGAPFAPYRTVVAIYSWRCLEADPMANF